MGQCPRHRVELLETLSWLGCWGQDAPSTQGEVKPSRLWGLGSVGEAGPMGNSSVLHSSSSTFASPCSSRKFLFIES